MGSAYVGAVVFQGALLHLGASHAIVYGVYPAVVSPIIIVAGAGVFAAVREDVQTLCAAIAIIAVLAGSAFAGPIWVWLSCAVGGCVVGLALAASGAAAHRRHAGEPAGGRRALLRSPARDARSDARQPDHAPA